MKKLITLIAIGMVAILVKAAPALRMPMTVTQPDGTTLTVEQFGDEHHHWTATTDGTMVINTGHGGVLNADTIYGGIVKDNRHSVGL